MVTLLKSLYSSGNGAIFVGWKSLQTFSADVKDISWRLVWDSAGARLSEPVSNRRWSHIVRDWTLTSQTTVFAHRQRSFSREYLQKFEVQSDQHNHADSGFLFFCMTTLIRGGVRRRGRAAGGTFLSHTWSLQLAAYFRQSVSLPATFPQQIWTPRILTSSS